MDEHTATVWLVLEGRWHRVNPERYEYLVECELPRHREWPIGHSPEAEAAHGAGPKGWWLARFSGVLSPVAEHPTTGPVEGA